MAEKEFQFKPFYPDVLGAVTGGPRITMEKLQVAVGVFPRQNFINQPFECLIILQSMVDAEMQVKIAMRLPTTDKKGSPAVIDTPKAQIGMTLKPGETGILHLPIVARPPTPAGTDYPIRIAVRYRTSDKAAVIRPPAGGAPPSVLSISPFKLQVLRDIEFNTHTRNESADIITVNFDIAPKRIDNAPQVPKPRYEPLWTNEQLPKEMSLARAQISVARKLGDPSQYPTVYFEMLDEVENRFAMLGLPLHPGESMAVAKMMTYTIDEAPVLEPHYEPEKTRWFPALCQVLASNPDLAETTDRNEILARHVFDEILYESIMLGFKVLQGKITEDLGSVEERTTYANRVMQWLSGSIESDLNYVYLPLILGGLAVNRLVRLGMRENAWAMVDDLTEALNGRIRLADAANIVVFEMANDMLEFATRELNRQRVPRE